MVLYTIVNEYDIWNGSFPEEKTACESWDGRYFECVQTPGGRMLRRVISTDPADYLNPRNQPGGAFSKP